MKTKKDYIEYLNEFAPYYESEEWTMGGKRREHYAINGKYGECMRKHDPIRFEVGFNEYKRERR